MGRTKPTAKRRKSRHDIKVNESFSFAFVNDVKKLPTSDGITNGDAEEPSAKRRKIEPSSAVPSFCVAKSQYTTRKPCAEAANGETFTERRQNVGEELQFYHMKCVRPGTPSTAADTPFRLQIIPRKNRAIVFNHLDMALETDNASDDFISIVRIGGTTCRSQGLSPGAVWSNFDITLHQENGFITFTLECQLYWNETPSPLNGLRSIDHRKVTENLISAFFPADTATASSPMDFYEAAHVPEKTSEIPLQIQTPGLDATLYPYQKRTLQWMLQREGVQWTDSGLQAWEQRTYPLSDGSRRVKDVEGRDMYLSDVLQTVSSSNALYCQHEKPVRGGILSEEMGLGKTLEILGLILVHPRPDHDTTSTKLRSGATLIVSPEPLRPQWITEIARHAPGLRFEFYRGCTREKGEVSGIAKRLADCDIVVTTYSVLSAEIHFALEGPERARRQERKYERRTSPLVLIEWWRLCLDEAQMIENGYSQAAITARTIPRVNAWGVTGTPVKDDVKDLFGLLAFLKYEPLCSAQQAWIGMLQSQKPIFQKIFNTIAVRHTKALVRDEIALPPQRRYTISVPFTAVEEQHYQNLFREMTEECGVDIHGNPIVDDWNPDQYEEEMRKWLNRLRQTALHPEVGTYGRRVLGQNRRPMRTVEEVLNAMLETSESAIRADQRALLSSKLVRGQMFENSPRVKEALAIWEDVKGEAKKMVAEARQELETVIREEGASGPQARKKSSASDSEDSEPEEADVRGRLGEARRRLRGALDMQHKAVFFCANAYFQIRENEELTVPDSDDAKELKKLEDEHYEQAKVIRREILKESHAKATKLMKKISRKADGQSFIEVAELKVRADRGIESGRTIDGLEGLYEALNEQANIVDEWREQSVQLLLKALLDEEDDLETSGEEMVDAAKMQDEMVLYVQVLRAAIADRQDAISGQKNELVDHETKVSIRMAKDGDGPLPEKLLELFKMRDQVKPGGPGSTSMRGAISELRSLVTRLRNDNPTERTRMELAIATRLLQDTQNSLTDQTKAAAALEVEVETFRTTMNARLEYYRQLQAVSDGVLPFEGAKTEDAVARAVKTEDDLARKVASAEAKHRYLLNLKEAGSNSNEPRMCVICQAPFETGVLTVCGHQFCKECMMHWYKAHRNCPVCKKHLTSAQLHDITMKPQELRLHGESSEQSNSQSPTTKSQESNGIAKKTGIYSTFNADKLAEIKNIELDGPSYTTKVDTLVRHLFWIRQTDPGAKSIVFSQYKDFLDVLATAFRRFRIGFASIDTHGGTTRFKDDPAVEVFLLHARAHSSGLNLVNANNVFLCEPLVNTALELQAIARVDRIGQEHETTVWLYVTQGTVEESIYNLSVQRRLKHMGERGKSKESTPEVMDASLEAANTLELETAALTKLMSRDKTAGEVVDKGDLWDCLFGHQRAGS